MPFFATLAEDAVLAGFILLNLVGWVCALGLLYIWNHTFHYLIDALARVLSVKIWRVQLLPTGWLHAIDHGMQAWFSDWALGSEITIGKCLRALGWQWAQLTDAVSDMGNTLERFAHWITDVHTPAVIAQAVAQLQRMIHHGDVETSAKAGQAQTAAAKAAHDAQTAKSDAQRAAAQAAAYPHPIPVAHPHPGVTLPRARATTPAHVLPAETDWTTPFGRTLHDLKRLARKHEGLFAASVMAGVMANVLGLPNWRCLTRGNIGKTARRLCGLPTHLLDDFLAVLADVWVLENVCVLIPLLETVTAKVAVPLVEGLTEIGAGLCKGSIGAPDGLQGAAPYPVPLTITPVLVEA